MKVKGKGKMFILGICCYLMLFDVICVLFDDIVVCVHIVLDLHVCMIMYDDDTVYV